MMISTKGRYALRVMVDLAIHGDGGYLPLKEVADRQDISEKYLESIMVVLSRAGYLDGLRGKRGGYRLTRKPEDYTVGSILRLTEGELAPVACLNAGETLCDRADMCCTLPMWREFYRITNEYFDGITIADLAASQLQGNNYVI